MWLRRTRRPKISADEFARNLYEGFVQERSGTELTDESRIPLPVRLRFLAKVELYRKAVLLMALMSQATVRAECEKVLRCY
jgi:hypothetical protein